MGDFKGLTTATQAARAEREVERLEALVKSGVATPEDERRYADGLDYVLIWGWVEEGRTQNEKRRK